MTPDFPDRPPGVRTTDDTRTRLADGCLTVIGGIALIAFVVAGWLGGVLYLWSVVFGG